MFKNKTILITGGTGSFGNAFLDYILKINFKEIRIFSRDEKKQDDMRKKYKNEKIKFYIGDVRDKSSISKCINNVDYIFHAAALKQVPSCEFYPIEAVKTNILGTENVINEAINHNVKKIVCLSTDKAVYPINAMGMSKGLMEKVIMAKARDLNKKINTKICCTRYGNVIASRGSVIPLFIDQVKNGKPITITNPQMTRFMMSLTDAVNLVLFAFKNGNNGDLFVQKSPAATIETISKVVSKLFGKVNHPMINIGTRHGEKLFEVLLSSEEKQVAINYKNYFKVKLDNRNLNYEVYFEKGQNKFTNLSLSDSYNSHNTKILSENELMRLLKVVLKI